MFVGIDLFMYISGWLKNVKASMFKNSSVESLMSLIILFNKLKINLKILQQVCQDGSEYWVLCKLEVEDNTWLAAAMHSITIVKQGL